MRLGELLVRAGTITSAQLAQALQQQIVYGARLGTNLIELGAVSADDLARALGRLLGVPAALEHHFARADPDLRALIPRELAARCSAYPIASEDTTADRRLVVCLRNPRHRDTVEALRAATGRTIIACAASELMLFAWMERGYGIRRRERYRHATPGSTRPLPPSASDQIAAVAPPDAGEPLNDLAVDVDLGDDDSPAATPGGLQLVDLDDHTVARDLTQYAAPGRPRESLLDIADRRAPAARAATTMTAASATAAVARATDRDDIADAVLAFLRGRFDAGLILIVREQMALGHRGFGGSFDDHTVESILIPLGPPSMFRTAVEVGRTCRGPAPSGGKAIHDRFFKLFALDSPPTEVVITPVVLRGRVVCLLYAHTLDDAPLDDAAVTELEGITATVTDAYIRLIRAAKRP